MPRCKYCFETKPDRFYDSNKSVCKPCLSFQNNKIFYLNPLPRSKTYADYLKKANLTDYARRYLKHFT